MCCSENCQNVITFCIQDTMETPFYPFSNVNILNCYHMKNKHSKGIKVPSFFQGYYNFNTFRHSKMYLWIETNAN